MPTGNDYTVRRISRNDIPRLERLFSQVYKRRVVDGYFEKKLATSYAGLEYAGFIASATNGEIVASLCMVPCNILINGTTVKSAQLTDGMTSVSQRRSGLFGQLASCVLDLAKQSGIELLFGFPNQDAFPALLKNNWIWKEDIDRFEIPVKRSINWYFSRLKGRRDSGFSKTSGNIHSVLKDGFDAIERNDEYVNYKLSLGNYGLVESGRGKAWIKTGADLSIGDMEVEDEGFDGLMKLVFREAVKNAAHKIHFQCSRGSRLHHLFGKRYRAIPSFPVVIKKINPDLNTDRIRFTYADIDIF
jgi:hypothetical protein